jgi:Lipopolysaccharide-assembly
MRKIILQTFSIALLAPLVALTGCANHALLPPGVKTAHLAAGLGKPLEKSYTTHAMRAAQEMSIFGGLAGALITAGVNAAVESNGKKSCAEIFRDAEPKVEPTLRASLTRELNRSQLLTVVPGTRPADCEIKIASLQYGLAQVAGDRFSISMSAEIRLVAPDGHEILTRVVWANSTSFLSISQPGPIGPVIQEAADSLASRFVVVLRDPSAIPR